MCCRYVAYIGMAGAAVHKYRKLKRKAKLAKQFEDVELTDVSQNQKESGQQGGTDQC